MEDTKLREYINECVDEFKKFVDINNFPNFDIEKKTYDIERIDKNGYGAIASASYCFSTCKHSLEINSNVLCAKEKWKPIVFHELTHIFDNEKIVHGDMKKAIISLGYEEYHASQIEFMKLVGASNMTDSISFKWEDFLNTPYGQKKVKDYVLEKRNIVMEFINQPDVSWNKNSLDNIVGCVFNYYGRYSICKMYQEDFKEENFEFNFEPLIDSFYTSNFNTYMQDWFVENKIKNFNNQFENFIYTLYRKYKII